jgi:hypothetical protein
MLYGGLEEKYLTLDEIKEQAHMIEIVETYGTIYGLFRVLVKKAYTDENT